MQVSFRIAGVAIFSAGVVLVVVSNFIVHKVVDEVNARSRVDQQIGMFFLQSKTGEILQRHRELFPDSSLRRRIYVVGITGLVMILAGFLVAIYPSFVASR